MKEKKKVLIITYYWPPSGGAGVQRWLKFAKYLPEFGIEPIILTVDPLYASYPQIDESLKNEISPELKVFKTKSFEPLNFLSKLIGKKNVPYGGFTNVKKDSILQVILRFIRGNFFIPDARVGWNRFAYCAAKEIILKFSINTVITTSPPHSTQLIGLKLKKKLDIRWIADFRDPWTDIYYYKDLLHLPIVKKKNKELERRVLYAADLIFANCDSNKELFFSKIGQVEMNKFYTITNGFDESDFKLKIESPSDFIITYIGTMSEIYEPEVFFEVLKEIENNYKKKKIRFRLVGQISPVIRKMIKNYKLDTIFEDVGYVNHDMAIKYMMNSSLLLYIFPKTDNDRGIAGKLFEYLASRIPILAIGTKDGDSFNILNDINAGKMFERNQKKEIYNYLCLILNRDYTFVNKEKINQFTRRNITDRLVKIIYN